MRSKVWGKPILSIVPVFLVLLSFANTAGAGMSAKTSDSDMAITSVVQEKFHSDSLLKDSKIFVETINGEVTLKGMVNSHADVTRAANLAHNVDGVKGVDNRLSTVNSHKYSARTPSPSCALYDVGEC